MMMTAVLAGAAMLQRAEEHSFSLVLVIHRLPLWFLVFSLFLPRIALVVAWFQGVLIPFHPHGLLPLIVAILLPRALILYLIYLDQGISLWFLIHLVVAVVVWSSGGRQVQKRVHQ
jgi:hypothetical protein